MRKKRNIEMEEPIPLWLMKSKLYLTDRQIKWLCILFPISAIIGPVGVPLNIIIYLIIVSWYLY